MTEVSFSPLRYYSFGLSTSFHILILFLLLYGVYKTPLFPPLTQPATSPDDYSAVYLDGEDEPSQQNVSYQPQELLEQQTTVEVEQESSPLSDQQDEMQSEILDPEQSQVEQHTTHEIPEPAQIARRIRARQRWQKKQPQPSAPSPTQAKAIQQAQALQENFSSFVHGEQQALVDKLAVHGSSVEKLENERMEYHKRVLQAIKATTHYFVKKYYAHRAFTTPKVHVVFELDGEGKITSLELNPSTGITELDHALKTFVKSTRFGKKPAVLQITKDAPYDFYILPLPIQPGENILKLVACF